MLPNVTVVTSGTAFPPNKSFILNKDPRLSMSRKERTNESTNQVSLMGCILFSSIIVTALTTTNQASCASQNSLFQRQFRNLIHQPGREMPPESRFFFGSTSGPRLLIFVDTERILARVHARQTGIIPHRWHVVEGLKQVSPTGAAIATVTIDLRVRVCSYYSDDVLGFSWFFQRTTC
jgi:hypothetical protein